MKSGNIIRDFPIAVYIDSLKRRKQDGCIVNVTIFSHVLNDEIIKRGYGKVNTKSHFKHIARFPELEKEAREAKRGLWASFAGSSKDSPKEPEPMVWVPEPEETTSSPSPTAPREVIPAELLDPVFVYVELNGTDYHRDGCQYLKKDNIRIALELAKEQGYTPCPHCKP